MSGQPKRIRLSRRKGWRLPENASKVDRATPWGNPFIVGVDGTREECVRLYRMLMAGHIAITAKATPAQQQLVRSFVANNRHRLRGRDLACWCSLDGPCHADVLLEVVNAPEARP